MTNLTIALAKGRLQDEAMKLFNKVGINIASEQLNSRRLLLTDENQKYNFVLVKPSDVPVYVEHGITDIGICGQDVLLETIADVHQPLDLGFGYCRIAVAGKTHEKDISKFSVLRVASKYPRIATEYFQSRGLAIEIIKLSGSVELAPLLGLADYIVDLVETGQTLIENGLEVKEIITKTTAQLIANRASFQLKRDAIIELIDLLKEKQISQNQIGH
ncbi:MAG: ATP phosphoribosyltransferase [Blastocatellia bacterium]|nr:ATP phosphoribosyltransferase [Blastocatellia bacterium]MBN8725740.1 ATP phosphoribosyltransferase [Acidobacteriota bacterium]